MENLKERDVIAEVEHRLNIARADATQNTLADLEALSKLLALYRRLSDEKDREIRSLETDITPENWRKEYGR